MAKLLEEAIALQYKAMYYEVTNDRHSAISSYKNAIAYYIEGVRYTNTQECLATLAIQINKCNAKLKDLKRDLGSCQAKSDLFMKHEGFKAQQRKQTTAIEYAKTSKEEQDVLNKLMATGAVGKPKVKFGNVAGFEKEKAYLKQVVPSQLEQPELNRSTFQAILLYGPSGAGKSFLANSLAGEAQNCTFLSLSASDLLSTESGVSERLVKMLFKVARMRKPSIVFIDELELLRTVRTANDKEGSAQRFISELCIQMDGEADKNEGILFLASTTAPYNLDNALLGRFHKKLYIPLPCGDIRKEIFLTRFKNRKEISLPVVHEVVELTKGLSASAIVNLCDDAEGLADKRLERWTHFEIVTLDGNKIYQISAGALAKTLDEIKLNQLRGLDRVTKEDLLQSARAARKNLTDCNLILLLEAFGRNSGPAIVSPTGATPVLRPWLSLFCCRRIR